MHTVFSLRHVEDNSALSILVRFSKYDSIIKTFPLFSSFDLPQAVSQVYYAMMLWFLENRSFLFLRLTLVTVDPFLCLLCSLIASFFTFSTLLFVDFSMAMFRYQSEADMEFEHVLPIPRYSNRCRILSIYVFV